MAKKWSEVESSPQYQSLSPEQQDNARTQYFDQVIAPQVPEGQRDQVKQQFFTDTAPKQVQQTQQADTKPEEHGMLGKAFLSVAEPAATLATGAISAPLSGLAGGLAIASKALGFTETDPADVVRGVQKSLTYEPKSEVGKQATDIITKPLQWLSQGAEKAGDVALKVTGSPAVATAVNVAIQSIPALLFKKTGGEVKAASVDTQALAQEAAKGAGLDWEKLPTELRSELTKIAEDSKALGQLKPEQLKAVAEAKSLKSPVELTKGQATRSPEQLRAEAQTAQLKGGEPLLQRQEEQNAALNENVDILRNRIKSAGKDAESQGKTMHEALKSQEDWSKKRYQSLYDKARKQEGNTPVPNSQALADQVNENPVLLRQYKQDFMDAGAKIKDGKLVLDKDLNLNQLEEIRKQANADTQSMDGRTKFNATGMVKGIDDFIESQDVGGDLYKQARSAYKAHRQTFDKSAIENVIGEKPSGERKVALENITKKVASPTTSIEDLEGLKRQYLLGGNTKELRVQGRQAWRDLQAGTLDFIKNESQGGLTSERGREFSYAGFQRALDKIGDKKLELIMGKSAANELRKIAKVAENVKTQPPKRGIGSDTSINLMTMLDRVADHLPVVGKYAVGAARGVKRLGAEGAARKKAIESIKALPEAERPKAIYKLGDALLKSQKKPSVLMGEAIAGQNERSPD